MLNALYGKGYLELSSPDKNLQYLKLSELKNILRDNAQKVSGTKQELIDRIISNIDLETLKSYHAERHY